jgi:hypothetical protein
MARRFVLDDRRPTSVVSQGIYLFIKTDLTVAVKYIPLSFHTKCISRTHTSFWGISRGMDKSKGESEEVVHHRRKLCG